MDNPQIVVHPGKTLVKVPSFDFVVRHDQDPVLVADVMYYIPGNWKTVLSHRPENQQRNILKACRRRYPEYYTVNEGELAPMLELRGASHTGSPLTAGNLSSSVEVCKRFLDTPFAAWVRLALGDVPWIFDELRAIIDEVDVLWTKHSRPVDPVMSWAVKQDQQLDKAVLAGIRSVIDSRNCRQTIRRLRILDNCFEDLSDSVKRSESSLTTAEWLNHFSAYIELLIWIESKSVTELVMCLTTKDIQCLQHFDARDVVTNNQEKRIDWEHWRRLFKVTEAYVKIGSRNARFLVDVASQARRIDNDSAFMAVSLGLQSAAQYAGDNAKLQKFLRDTSEILSAHDYYRAYRVAQARAYALPWTIPFVRRLSAQPTLPLSDRDRMLGPMLTSISSFLVHWRDQRGFESYNIAVVGTGGDTWLDQTLAEIKFAFPIGRNQLAGGGRRWKTLMRIDEHFAEVHFYLQSFVDEVGSAPSCYIFASSISPQEYITMNLWQPMLALHPHVLPAFSLTPLSTGSSLRYLDGVDDEEHVAELIRIVRQFQRPTASAAQVLKSSHISPAMPSLPATEARSAFDTSSPLSDDTRPDKTMAPLEHGYSENTTPPLEIPTYPVSNTGRNVKKAKSIGTLKAQTKRFFTRNRSGSG